MLPRSRQNISTVCRPPWLSGRYPRPILQMLFSACQMCLPPMINSHERMLHWLPKFLSVVAFGKRRPRDGQSAGMQQLTLVRIDSRPQLGEFWVSVWLSGSKLATCSPYCASLSKQEPTTQFRGTEFDRPSSGLDYLYSAESSLLSFL